MAPTNDNSRKMKCFVNINLLRRVLPSLLVTAALASGSLITCGCSQMEKSEQATAEEEAALIEGRKAAREVVRTPVRDTSDLFGRVRHVEKIRDSLYSGKDEKCRAAFDSAFIHTVKAVAPDVEKQIRNR